jgi:hypothetical protein
VTRYTSRQHCNLAPSAPTLAAAVQTGASVEETTDTANWCKAAHHERGADGLLLPEPAHPAIGQGPALHLAGVTHRFDAQLYGIDDTFQHRLGVRSALVACADGLNEAARLADFVETDNIAELHFCSPVRRRMSGKAPESQTATMYIAMHNDKTQTRRWQYQWLFSITQTS